MNTSTKVLLIAAVVCVLGFGAVLLFVPGAQTQAADANEEKKVVSHAQTQVQAKKIDTSKASLDNFFALWQQGNKEGANKQMQALLKLTPNDPNLKLINADFQRFYTGSPDTSIAMLREYLQSDADSPQAHASLAHYLAEREDGAAEALQHASTAISLAQKQGETVLVSYWETYGWTLALNHKTDDALNIYVQNVFQNEAYTVDDPSAMLHFAYLLEDTGLTEEAAGVYNDIRDLMVTQVDAQGQADLEWAQKNAEAGLERLGS